MAGIGCGEQLGIHTNTGPVTNLDANAPTPATATATVTPTESPTRAATASDQPTNPEANVPSPVTSTETLARDGAVSDAQVTLKKVTFDDFLKWVKTNPSKPRYTLVDSWATWCAPCKENLPHLVAMHHKYADKGLSVATMSFDDPTNQKQADEAVAFLRKIKATFPNFLHDEGENVGFDKFDFTTLPGVFLYDSSGKEVKRFTMDDPNNQFTYDEVEKAVADLLGAT